MRNSTLTVPLLALFTITACGGETKAPPAAGLAAAAEPAPISAHGSDRPASGAPAGAVRVDGAAVSVAGLGFDLPAPFRSEPPASPMRLFQAAVAGEAGPAELVLFHFGAGQGGGVEANIERWLGQFERPAGSEPERGVFPSGAFQVTWIDVSGTLLPSGMGMGPTTPQPGSRLFGAVVEGDGGPWFFKLTGPEATVVTVREPLLGMLRALRAAG